MEPFEFEVLTAEDDNKAVEFCRKIYAEMGWTEETLGTSILDAFSEPGDVFVVVKQDGEIIGTYGLQRLSDTETVLKKFYLAKNARGSGIAARMFEDALKRARELGYTTLVLDVSTNNERAVSFYQKMNMEEFVVIPHPRWWESSPEGQKTHRYFRMRL